MPINILVVTYNPTSFIQIMDINDEIIKKIQKINNRNIELLKFIDPYDNSFFNKKQILKIECELNELLQENDQQIVTFAKNLSSTINDILSSKFNYLIFLGD